MLLKRKKSASVLFSCLLALVLASTSVAAALPAGGVRPSGNETQNSLTANGFEVRDTELHMADKYVRTVEGEDVPLSADDKVWIIVQPNGDSLVDMSAQAGMDVTEFLGTRKGKTAQSAMLGAQTALKRRLNSRFSDISYKYSYTTLLNGFAAEVSYGDVEAIRGMSGVGSVIVSERYSLPLVETTENVVDVYETGIYDSSEVGYTGSGTVVAVVDTGLDYTHTAFQNQPDEAALALTRDDVTSVINKSAAALLSGGDLDADDVYVSDKVPFAYDYADKDSDVYPQSEHGTHVAGIIAGKDDVITGVAVDAQLAIFKVFSNYKTGAETVDILAGVSDAVLLGVDVINMSLGTSCGFTDDRDEAGVDVIYNRVREAGISLIVAASNDYSSAMSSENGDYNLTSNPDSGTVGAPATYPAAMAVASISGVKADYILANGETAVYVNDASNSLGDKTKFVEKMLKGEDRADYEYVTVPGVGRDINYTGLNVQGKIALVQRGITTFEEKVKTAAEHKAAAVVIYNNVSGVINMSVGTFMDIPACSVTMDVGKILAASATGTMQFNTAYKAGPFMSDFSSWGVLPNLELKPEITAHGGEIYSAVPGGYDRLSGTSMAAPNMAGATTLVKQYIDEKFPELTDGENTDLAYRLMMSTATPARNEEGNPYSPRKQGAGLAAIKESVSTPAYLYVEGSNKTKLSLGHDPEKTGVYTMNFRIRNMSNQAVSYRAEVLTMTETVSSDGKTVAEKAYMLDDTAAEVTVAGGTYAGGIISVAGYGDAQITVKLTISAAAKEYLDMNFANGMYVEGFVRLLSMNGDGIDLGIPYVAFYGDWTQAPILDYTAYEYAADKEDTDILEADKMKVTAYGSIPYGLINNVTGWNSDGTAIYEESYWHLGDFAYVIDDDLKPYAKEDKAAISTGAETFSMLKGLMLGTIRGVKRAEVEVVDAFTGEVIYETVKHNIHKSYGGGGRVPGYLEFDLDPVKYGLMNNTKYTINVTTYLDWDGPSQNNRNTYSSSFYIDYEKPILDKDKLELRVEEKSDKTKRYLLDMYLYDNHYLQAMIMSTFSGEVGVGGYLEDEELLTDGIYPLTSQRGATTKLTFDITSKYDTIMRNGGNIALQVMDYALNSASFTMKIPQLDPSVVGFKTENQKATIKLNQFLDLKPYLDNKSDKDTADKAYSTITDNLIWSTSDPSVAEVKDGVVYGKKTGAATITVKAPYTDSSATFELTVSDKVYADSVEISKIKLSDEFLSMVQGDEKQISFTVEPWAFDPDTVEFVWGSSDPDVLRITPDPNDPYKATVKALNQGSAYITVSLKSGGSMSGNLPISVKELFTIENGVLKKYNGHGDENGVVDVPVSKGVRIINFSAFAGIEGVKKIVLHEGTEYIYESAFYGMPDLEEVVLPSTVKELPKWAFGWCTNLKKINLENVVSIGELAFYHCPLETLSLDKTVYIGSSAFSGNPALTYADLSKVSYIDKMAFALSTGLKRIKLGANTTVGINAFAYCSGLLEATIPGRFIGEGAFAGAASLATLNITGKNVLIGDGAFGDCTGLKSVSFAGTVDSIGKGAFENCTALNRITLPDGLDTLGEGAFKGSGLTVVGVSADTRLSALNAKAFEGTKVTAFEAHSASPYLKVSDDGKLLLSKDGGVAVLSVPTLTGAYVLPNSVVTIGRYAFSGTGVTAVTGNANVIGKGAFYDCASLTAVTAPAKFIGEYAFYNCNALGIADLASGATAIGAHAFERVNAAASGASYALTVAASEVGAYAFAGVSDIASVAFTGEITVLAEGLFRGAAALTSVTGIDDVYSIGAYAFAGTALTSFTLSDGVREWGKGAFADNTKLSKFVLNDTVETIPAEAFSGCTMLQAFDFKNVKEIGGSAFAGCARFNPATLGSVEYVGDAAFADAGVTKFYAPELLETGRTLFTVKERGSGLLTSFNAPKLQILGSSALAVNTKLTSVNVPELREIGVNAFYKCTALKSIDLPKAEIIGAVAFEGCSALGTLNIPAAKYVGQEFVSGTNLTSFHVGALAYAEEGAFSGAYALTAFEGANDDFYTRSGVLYRRTGAGDELFAYPLALKEDSFTVPEGVVRIAAYAFAYVTPSDEKAAMLTYKDAMAEDSYYNGINSYVGMLIANAAPSTITEITLPRSLKTIGDGAFMYVMNLDTVHFKSPAAPALESDNRLVSLSYTNFVTLAHVKQLSMTYPVNGSGYDSYVYTRLFETAATTGTVMEDATVEAIDAINALPEKASVTEADRQAVEAARRKYDRVSDLQREFVENYERLTDAESVLRVIDVKALIGKIPENAKDDTDAVTAARTAYDALTETEKQQITNYDKLTAAEKQLGKKGCGCSGSIAGVGGAMALIVGLLLVGGSLIAVALKRKAR